MLAYWSVDNWHVIIKDVAQLFLALTGFVAGVTALVKTFSNGAKISSLFVAHDRNAQDIRQLNSDQTQIALKTPTVVAMPTAATESTAKQTDADIKEVGAAVQQIAKKSKP